MTMGIAFVNTDLVAVNVISVKRDSQAACVMNANRISLVTSVMNANQIISIIQSVKVCLNNCFLKSQTYIFFYLRMYM